MSETSINKFKVIVRCAVALVFIAAAFYVYRWSTTKPICNCMFPNSQRYGVVGQGGKCRVVDCEVKRASR